jgi:hypothetical protein
VFIITAVIVVGTPSPRAALEGIHDGAPVAAPAREVMLVLRREVERELDAVKALDGDVREHGDALTVRRDARFDALRRQLVEDVGVLRMHAVFPDTDIDGSHGQCAKNAADVLERQAVDGGVGPVAVGAAEVALVREPDADGELHQG